MTRQSPSEARERIVDDLRHVETTGEPVVFQAKDGKTVAVLVAAEDFEALSRLRNEDRRNAEEAERRLDDPGETPVPWEKVKRDLGL